MKLASCGHRMGVLVAEVCLECQAFLCEAPYLIAGPAPVPTTSPTTGSEELLSLDLQGISRLPLRPARSGSACLCVARRQGAGLR